MAAKISIENGGGSTIDPYIRERLYGDHPDQGKRIHKLAEETHKRDVEDYGMFLGITPDELGSIPFVRDRSQRPEPAHHVQSSTQPVEPQTGV